MPPRLELDDLPPPELVEDEPALAALLARLADAREIAFDTEADSFYSYQERVCLIQVSVEGMDYLVDPLGDLDVRALGPVFADPARTKVFHDGEYDILLFKREYGFEFASIFDTRVAAAALGVEQPGLASVLGERFGIELDKSQQRSDWSRRPLSPQQIAYARLDTRFLLELMRELRVELEARDRLRIVEGECRRLESLEAPVRGFEPDEFLRIKGARKLDPRGLQALRELFVWRDGEARRRNVPPFKVLGNRELFELAQRQPSSMQGLEKSRGMSSKMIRRIGRPVLGALARAAELGPLKRIPQLPAKDGTGGLDDVEFELHERLKAWRRDRAASEGMDASLVLNRLTLLELARVRPSDTAALAGMDGIVEWQVEQYGTELIALFREFEEDVAAGRIPPSRRGRRRR